MNMDYPSTDSIAIQGELMPLLKRDGRKRWNLQKMLRVVGTAGCILVCIVTWVTMAQLLRNMGSGWRKPFFQAYFIHSFYSVLYVGWKIWLIFPGNFACNSVGEGALTNFKNLGISTGVLGLLAYLSGSAWYLSLPLTSLSANTAVYQSASAVVFILSVPLLREKVSVLKVLSVAFTIAGVCLISVFSEDRHKKTSSTTPSNHTLLLEAVDKKASNGTPLGYVFLVVSMVLYASFEVGFKKFATKPGDSAPVQNSVRAVGYMGVHTLFWMWPLLVVLHFTGLETFELPDLPTFKALVINASLDVVYNGFLLVCIALSSPLVTTVGTVLVVPASLVVDWLLHHYLLPWQAILGIVGILAGFFGLVCSESVEILFWRKHFREDITTSINTKVQPSRTRYWKYVI